MIIFQIAEFPAFKLASLISRRNNIAIYAMATKPLWFSVYMTDNNLTIIDLYIAICLYSQNT